MAPPVIPSASAATSVPPIADSTSTVNVSHPPPAPSSPSTTHTQAYQSATGVGLPTGAATTYAQCMVTADQVTDSGKKYAAQLKCVETACDTPVKEAAAAADTAGKQKASEMSSDPVLWVGGKAFAFADWAGFDWGKEQLKAANDNYTGWRWGDDEAAIAEQHKAAMANVSTCSTDLTATIPEE